MYDVNEDNFRIYLRRQEADQVLRQALPRRSHIVERIFPSKIENQENSRDVRSGVRVLRPFQKMSCENGNVDNTLTREQGEEKQKMELQHQAPKKELSNETEQLHYGDGSLDRNQDNLDGVKAKIDATAEDMLLVNVFFFEYNTLQEKAPMKLRRHAVCQRTDANQSALRKIRVFHKRFGKCD